MKLIQPVVASRPDDLLALTAQWCGLGVINDKAKTRGLNGRILLMFKKISHKAKTGRELGGGDQGRSAGRAP